MQSPKAQDPPFVLKFYEVWYQQLSIEVCAVASIFRHAVQQRVDDRMKLVNVR